MHRSFIFALALLVISLFAGQTLAAETQAASNYRLTLDALDPGNDHNIEAENLEASAPDRQSLFPIDRPLRDASQAWKRNLKDRIGLDFALESTTIYQITSGVRPANQAAVNTVTLAGIWKFLRNPDNDDGMGIGFAGETRNNPINTHFTQLTHDIGTLWSPNDSTSDAYVKVTQLWLGQRLLDNKLVYLIGKVDPGSLINGNRFAGSGNTQFFSQPFATNPAKTFPDNGIGAIGRFNAAPWLYFQGVVADSDAVSNHSPFTTINGHWFYAGEIALKPIVPILGEGNYRFLFFHNETQPQSTSGWALSFDQNLGEDLGVFFRFGDNDGRANPVKWIASGGFSFLQPFGRRNDQAGIGISMTSPSNPQFREEYSAETYYRVQLTEFFEFSASAQAIYHPSAATEDLIGVFGVRMRFLF
jgi:hypothetical protein